MFVKELPLSDSLLKLLEERFHDLPFSFNPMVHLQQGAEEIERAGILPFVAKRGAEGWEFTYYVMKPKPKHLGSRGEPLFQIAKGTRYYREMTVEGEERWVDGKTSTIEHYRHRRPEPLLRTALREGMEEISLEPMAIDRLFDYGPVAFRSEQTAAGKSMWLYLAQFGQESDLPFLPPDHPTTEASRWCSLPDFQRIGRPDHLMIITHVEHALADYFEVAEKLAN